MPGGGAQLVANCMTVQRVPGGPMAFWAPMDGSGLFGGGIRALLYNVHGRFACQHWLVSAPAVRGSMRDGHARRLALACALSRSFDGVLGWCLLRVCQDIACKG